MRRFQALALAAAAALVLASVAGATTGNHAVGSTITVPFTDRSLKATPASPSAGTTTFVVVNKGRNIHRLLIKGPGVKGVQSLKLADPGGLGDFAAFFLDGVPATSLSAKGNESVVAPEPVLPPMCGATYTP